MATHLTLSIEYACFTTIRLYRIFYTLLLVKDNLVRKQVECKNMPTRITLSIEYVYFNGQGSKIET